MSVNQSFRSVRMSSYVTARQKCQPQLPRFGVTVSAAVAGSLPTEDVVVCHGQRSRPGHSDTRCAQERIRGVLTGEVRLGGGALSRGRHRQLAVNGGESDTRRPMAQPTGNHKSSRGPHSPDHLVGAPSWIGKSWWRGCAEQTKVRRARCCAKPGREDRKKVGEGRRERRRKGNNEEGEKRLSHAKPFIPRNRCSRRPRQV